MRKLIGYLILIVGASLAAPLAAQDAGTSPCSSPEAAQFDFWVGEWKVTANDRLAGHNRITKILGGCVLLEEYRGERGGYEGKSFNYYDPTDGMWHQVWVDNGGLRLHLAGRFAGGKMVLSGERRGKDGAPVTDRITWSANDDGTVRQHWETSGDSGASWKTAFDGRYEKE